MKINENNLHDLDKIGIYKITNLKNNKIYVGSTRKSFYSRYKSHYEKLRTNNHKAYHYLQASWNKYGGENFEFSIIEICNYEECVQREKYWINFLECYKREIGYNINRNPDESPILTLESRMKVSKTLKELYRIGRLHPNDTSFKNGLVPWNKGKHYESTDHLKVPKRIKADKTNVKNTKRTLLPNILVYDINENFIGEWRSAKDIEDFSKTNQNNLPINGRFKVTRMNIPIKVLQSVNINKSCTYKKPYKGLIFKYKNTEVHIKSDKLLENPVEDNQQPIINLNN